MITKMKPDKPKFLYHASPNNDIEILDPRAKSFPDDWENREVVFATQSPQYASFFIVPTTDVWASMGTLGTIFYFVCADKKSFMEKDVGGTIYKLPPDSFYHHEGYEWYSTESVKPIDKKYIKSGLDHMIENGVQVYFVDEDTLKKIRASKDHGASMLNSMVSDNEKRNLNVKIFDIRKKK